ncbi:hypothetical protein RUND412_006218 [Rhizina undulata]
MVKQKAQGQWRAGLSSSKKRHEKKNNFRLRAAVSGGTVNGQPSLLARRAATNAAVIQAYHETTLIPSVSKTIDLTSPEVIDLITPLNAVDSGYFTVGPTCAPTPAKRSDSIELPELSSAPKSSVTAHDYTATMHQLHDAQFYKKYVTKQYRHNPKKAREDLNPIMRKMLEKPEDRPMINKFYLTCNFKKGTIRGEARLIRKPPRKSGERVIMGGSSEQMTEYFGEKIGYA